MTNSTTQTIIKNPIWWHRRSALERRLILVEGVALLVTVGLAIWLVVVFARQQHQSDPLMMVAFESKGKVSAGAGQMSASPSATQRMQDVCLTPGCVRAASEVLKKLDPSVHPCDSFYLYACSNYIRTASVPDDKVWVHALSDLKDEILEKLRKAIEDEETEEAVPRNLQLARGLYSACTNKTLIKSRGVAPLQRILKEELGGWPVLEGDSWDEASFDWRDSAYRFRRAGYSADYFIKVSVEPDYRNSTRRAIYLDQASLRIDRGILLQGLSTSWEDSYYQYQVQLAVLLGADRARAESELRHSLDFEIALANISLPEKERHIVTQLYNPYTLEQLQREYPSVTWLEYLQKLMPPHVAISEDEVVIVMVPSYLKGLEVLLSHTSKRVMANYAMWQAAEASVVYMTRELQDLKLEYESSLPWIRRREWEFRWKKCLHIVNKHLPLSVGSIYARRYFNEDAKNAALDIVHGVRQQFLHLLEEVDWMDEGTRLKALDKASSMVVHVAYPDDDSKVDEFYQKLHVSPTMFLESMLNITKFLTDYSFSQLREPIDRADSVSHNMTATIDVLYNHIKNSVEISVGALQGVYFSADRPKYMNYGGIGSEIGFRITQGFIDQGRQFDKDGNLVDWWDPVTCEKYLKKANCVSGYDSEHMSEIPSLAEVDIGFVGGLKAAYGAYVALERRSSRPEPRLPGLASLSPRQMFWLSYMQRMCFKWNDMGYMNTTRAYNFTDIGSLTLVPEFAEDFQCPPGSGMNPVKQCHVW